MGLSVQEAIDVGTLTLKNFKRDEFQYALDHNNYPIVEKLFRGRDIDEQTGKMISRDVVLGQTGNSGHVKLFQADTQNVTNIVKEILVPWRHAKSSMTYEHREVLVQGGTEGFVKLLKVRKANMYVEFANEIEERAWKTPNNSDDDINPWGIPYWLPLGTDGDTGSFNACYPSYNDVATDFSSIGGLTVSSSVNPKFRSYYADYDAVNDTLLQRMSSAFRKTAFQSPAIAKDLSEGPLSKFKLYTNDSVLTQMESLARQSDDQVGYDLGKYAGRTAFKRIPLDYVSILDTANTRTFGTDPIFGINWNYLEPVVLKGDRFRESAPLHDRAFPNVYTVFLDLSYNFVCTNRQRVGFLVSKQ